MKRYIRSSSDGNWLNRLPSEEQDAVEKGWDEAVKKANLDVAYHENDDAWLLIKDKKVIKQISDYDRMEMLASAYKNTNTESEFINKVADWLKK